MIDISSRAIDKPTPDDRNARTSAPPQILPWLAIEARGYRLAHHQRQCGRGSDRERTWPSSPRSCSASDLPSRPEHYCAARKRAREVQ